MKPADLEGPRSVRGDGEPAALEPRESVVRESRGLEEHLAFEEGIVPGGGVALIRAVESLDDLDVSEERRAGINIVRRALEAPLRKIAGNAGVECSIVVQKVREGQGAFGYNAATDTYEDLVEAGVVDPTKVVRIALQNAASVAGLMITTECLVAEKPKKDKTPSTPSMGGMGY